MSVSYTNPEGRVYTLDAVAKEVTKKCEKTGKPVGEMQPGTIKKVLEITVWPDTSEIKPGTNYTNFEAKVLEKLGVTSRVSVAAKQQLPALPRMRRGTGSSSESSVIPRSRGSTQEEKNESPARRGRTSTDATDISYESDVDLDKEYKMNLSRINLELKIDPSKGLIRLNVNDHKGETPLDLKLSCESLKADYKFRNPKNPAEGFLKFLIFNHKEFEERLLIHNSVLEGAGNHLREQVRHVNYALLHMWKRYQEEQIHHEEGYIQLTVEHEGYRAKNGESGRFDHHQTHIYAMDGTRINHIEQDRYEIVEKGEGDEKRLKLKKIDVKDTKNRIMHDYESGDTFGVTSL